MKRTLIVSALALALAAGSSGAAQAQPLHASDPGLRVYVYADDPHTAAELCAEYLTGYYADATCVVRPTSEGWN